MSENIEDKIVNHIICRKILLPLEKYLIDSNCATRVGRGSGYARKLLDRYLLSLNSDIFYILKFDIKKYFYSINHKILLSKLNKYLNDDEMFIINNVLKTTNYNYINDTIMSFGMVSIYKYGYGIILSKDKDYLRYVFDVISIKLKNEYDLVFNSKTKIYKSSEGFEFIGYLKYLKYEK